MREYAQTAVDVLARRTRLAFIDNAAARKALDEVLAILAEELHWNKARIARERTETLRFLDTMQVPEPAAAAAAVQ